MKIVIAPNSFKESLTSIEVCEIIEETLKKLNNGIITEKIPLADGGDGTISVLQKTLGGEIENIKISDPLGKRKIPAPLLRLSNKKTIVIEIASSSGLHLLKKEDRNPLYTSTYGTGELLKKVISEHNKIWLAVGGSSTVDGGMGILAALGFVFLDKNGKILQPKGENLINIKKIIYPNDYDSLLGKITILADVVNPLLGTDGTVEVFAKQKGADKNGMDILKKGIINFLKKYLEQCLEGCLELLKREAERVFFRMCLFQ